MSIYFAAKLNLLRSVVPVCTSVRWKKFPKRKPTWLPVAPAKVFRIAQHPYVPEDEKQLVEDLLDEYIRKFESLRKVFQEEMKQYAGTEENIFKLKQKEEEEFHLLLEENKKENERVRALREETLENEFQENVLKLMEMDEERIRGIEQRKLKVEEIVRIEKNKCKEYITLDTLDAAIEKAIDSPVNICFSLDLNGNVKWEGKPPTEYELEIKKRIATGQQS